MKEQISLLVPLNRDCAERTVVWSWLARYWRHELPHAEIVIGHDRASVGRGRKKLPFSKTTAVNDAFRRSHGDVIAVLDADAYIPGAVIAHAAARLRMARRAGTRMWFVPYRHIYRLTRQCTLDVLAHDPRRPLRFSTPPPLDCVEDSTGSAFGHRYGALVQIMPREAFEFVGGMDCRFRGWGGEDVSFLRALDTLWTQHKNLPGDVLHLWHPKVDVGQWQDPRGAWWEYRVWAGQTTARANDALTLEYVKATGNVVRMRELVTAGCQACRKLHPWWWRFWHSTRCF